MSKSAAGANTQTAILDAAEHLFAAQGFDGVPMREIAKQAGVGLSLLTYHFPSKEGLFDRVISRRVDDLNEIRIKMLREFEQRPDRNLREFVSAFVIPFVELTIAGGSGWQSYGELVAQVTLSPRYTDIISRHFNATLLVFAEALEPIFPGAPKELLTKAVLHSVALMSAATSTKRRLASLVDENESPSSLRKFETELVDYICGGIANLMAQQGHEIDEPAPWAEANRVKERGS